MGWFSIRRRRVRPKKRRSVSAKSKNEFKILAPVARAVVHERLAYFAPRYGFIYNKVFIRNTRTRWGTCSSLGNLSFNYRIAKLPANLQSYIVVHELCHLKEMNHSGHFWALVAEQCPEWRQLRAALRKISLHA